MNEPAKAPPTSITIYITREHGVEFFMLHIPKADGSMHTEELDPDDTSEWFRARGADMVLTEKALDHCWNFYKCAIEIINYKEPPVLNPAMQPNID